MSLVPSWRLVFSLPCLLLLVGCAQPLQPIASNRAGTSPLNVEPAPGDQVDGQTNFFSPLDVGDHWSYDNTFTILESSLDGPPGTPSITHFPIEYDLTGTAQRFGRTYVVQRETYGSGDQSSAMDFLYRQDFSGLFNADPETSDEVEATSTGGTLSATGTEDAFARALDAALSPSTKRIAASVLAKVKRVHQLAMSAAASQGRGHATPGPLEGEIPLLLYPLHSGQSWQVREDPLILYTVEGQEMLDLPAGRFNAWRIRIEWPDVFGPADRATVWRGGDGLLRVFTHFQETLVDEQGHPYGQIVAESSQDLTGVSLVHPSGT